MNYAQIIKSTRKNLNLTQKEMAKKLNITQTYLSLIEKGEKKPSLNLLEEISNISNIPIPVIIFLSYEPPMSSPLSIIKQTLNNLIEATK